MGPRARSQPLALKCQKKGACHTESYTIVETPGGFEIRGFPEGSRLVSISEADDPRVRQIAQLALHKVDLDFAAACLDEIPRLPEDRWVQRQALWRSAIVHLIKCFAKNRARGKLCADDVFQGAPPEANKALEYFRNLRNRHLVHDENPYSQCLVGAVINNGNKAYKIEKVLAEAMVADTLDESHYKSLVPLVQTARAWVAAQFDELCNLVTQSLEGYSYEELARRPPPQFRVPSADAVDQHRGDAGRRERSKRR